MFAHIGRLAFLTLLDQQVPVDRLSAPDAVSFGAYASLFSEETGDMTRPNVMAVRRVVVPPKVEAFSGGQATAVHPRRESVMAKSEMDLTRLLVGRWEATVIGAGPYYGSCSELPKDRRRRGVTFHEGGNYQRSIEPTSGRWLAAGQFVVVQFKSARGSWHDGDGRPGASKHFVEVLSRDQLLLRPAGGLVATEQYRRCPST